jgi:hypothetical protein
MPTVVTLPEITPLPRYDSTPWADVQVEESAGSLGPFTIIDTQTLSPIDSTPSNPAPRRVTTNDATLPNGYYRLVFRDATLATWTSEVLRPASALQSANWFSLADLQDAFPHYGKLQAASSTFVDGTIIPQVQWFILKYSLATDTDPVLTQVAKNYAVAKILGDDENIKIAQARGQSSLTIAGDQINLDLSQGRNFFLSAEDEAILNSYRERNLTAIHTDKQVVASQGVKYDPKRRGTDYTKDDGIRYPSSSLRP